MKRSAGGWLHKPTGVDMSKILEASIERVSKLDQAAKNVDRRNFLRLAGATIAVLGVAGCSDDDNPGNNNSGSVTLTNDDFGVLNYAYALEQLEAAFYTRVVSSFYSGATSEEQAILTDIRDHEIAHRDFFKQALGDKAIASLEVDFSSINFTNRESVLGTAKTFEDLGVSAYNGAGKILTSTDFLVIAGKIVSVEARHAAVIRDLLMKNTASFAGDDIVDPTTGLDRVLTPAQVLQAADPYVKTTITSNLPS